MKISDKTRAKIERHRNLMELKREFGLSKFYLYRQKKGVQYVLSRSEWLAVKNKTIVPVRDPDKFLEFLTVSYIRFTFDEKPDILYTNIQDFIEEYLITKLARI